MSPLTQLKLTLDTDPLGYGYALLLAAGGIFGFLKAQSLPSLIAGLTFSALSYSGVDRFHATGKADVIIGATALLTLVMGRRWTRTGKFMPPGLLTILSIVTLARYALTLL